MWAGCSARWPGLAGLQASEFSHVVAYGPQSALGSLEVVSLLDAASDGPSGR